MVVTEGFAGNIALKTAEGTARQIAGYLRAAMSRTLMARIGYMFAKGAFDTLREKMDVRKSNGGVFLGLNGIVVKSHGGADEEGFASAIELGYDMTRNRLLDRIEADLDLFHARHPQGPVTPAVDGPRHDTIGRDMIRSVVRGVGSALPRRAMREHRFRRRAGDLRRMDRPAHRYPPALHRRLTTRRRRRLAKPRPAPHWMMPA